VINPRHPKTLNPSLNVSFVPMPRLSETDWPLKFTEQRNLRDVLKGYTHFADGDVLFAKITPCMENGKAAVATGLANGLGCGTTELHVIRPLDGIDPRYIYHFLHQERFRREAALNFTGSAGQLRVPVSFIQQSCIPLAPPDEQRRIVAKLEALFTTIEACQKRLAKIPVILKRFRQSVLAAACSGRLTADWRDRNGAPIWEEKILGELILEKPKNGYSAKPVKYQTPFRVLTLTATTSGEFKPEHFKYFDGPVGADSGLWLQPDDILVQRGNTIEYVGVPAIYDGHPNEFIYPDLMMRLRARPEVDSTFLYFALSWERSRNYLRKKATGTAGSMPKINQQTLISVPIDLPPLAEQREIVRRVEGLFNLADQIEARYKKAQEQIDKLTQSILAKAFRGELVPTDADLARR